LRAALVFLGLAAPGLLLAQSPGTVQAQGSATLSANPDMVQISVGVVTDGPTAQAAAQANATQSTAVQNAFKGLNPPPVIQTTGYSIYPRYASQGQSQSIIGYTASNSIQVTSLDLSSTGMLIDTASQAGANNVSGLTFSVQNPEPLKQQALSQAAKQARAHADAIAAGLSGKTGAVVSAQEASAVSPVMGSPAAATTTPIQTGQVTVSASVTLTVQFSQ
jgi:uncharacterized protein YggE